MSPRTTNVERLYKITVEGEKAAQQIDKLAKATAKFDKAIEKNQAKLDQLGRANTSAANKMSKSWQNFNRTLIGLGAGLTLNFAKDVLVQFEDIRHALGVVTGSAEEGAIAFEALSDIAQKTPFNVNQLSESFLKLRAAGLAPTTQQMTLFADIASSTTDKIGALKAMSDLYARTTSGGLGLEDLNRLVDRGIPAFEIIAEKLGVTRLEISLLGKTTDGTNKIIGALENGLSELYSGATEGALGNLSTIMNNLGAETSLFIDEVATATGVLDGIKFVLVGLTDVIRGAKENIVLFTEDVKALEPVAVSLGVVALVPLALMIKKIGIAIFTATKFVGKFLSWTPWAIFFKLLYGAVAIAIANWERLKSVFESDIEFAQRKTLEDLAHKTDEAATAAKNLETRMKGVFALGSKDTRTKLQKEIQELEEAQATMNETWEVLSKRLEHKDTSTKEKSRLTELLKAIPALSLVIHDKLTVAYEKADKARDKLLYGDEIKLFNKHKSSGKSEAEKMKDELDALNLAMKKVIANPHAFPFETAEAQARIDKLQAKYDALLAKIQKTAYDKKYDGFTKWAKNTYEGTRTELQKISDEIAETEQNIKFFSDKDAPEVKIKFDQAQAHLTFLKRSFDDLEQKIRFEKEWNPFKDAIASVKELNESPFEDLQTELSDIGLYIIKLTGQPQTLEVIAETEKAQIALGLVADEITDIQTKANFEIEWGGFKDAIADVKQLNRTPLGDLQERISKLGDYLAKLKDESPMTLEVNMEIENTENGIKILTDEMNNLGETALNFEDILSNSLATSLDSLAQGFVDFAMGAQSSFSKFAKQFLKDITAMIAKAVILNAIQNGIDSWGAKGKGATVATDFDGTNGIGDFGRSRLNKAISNTPVIPTALLKNAMPPTSMYRSTSPSTENNAQNMNKEVAVNVKIDNYGNDKVEVKQEGNDLRVIIAAVANDILKGGGEVSRAMQQSYGVSRSRTAY